MGSIIVKFFNKRFKTLNIIQGINSLLVLIYAATFPMLADQQETLSTLIKNMPDGFIKAFSLDTVSMMTFEGYLATKHFMPFWIIILVVVAIPAATFISRSLDNNTVELIFAQPISRTKSALSIFISALLQTLYFTFISIAIIIPVGWLFGIDLAYSNYFILTIEALAFTFFITALTFVLDIFLSDSGKTTGLIILFTAGSYVLYLISKIITDLDFTKYFSAFYYFDPSKSLGSAEFGAIGFFGFLIIGIILVGISIWRFNRKDLSR